jgi:hypothetical protein
MMNDPGELTYGADRIKRWYELEGQTLPKHPALHMILRSRIKDFEAYLLDNPAYVVSASTSYRIVNQWRNYSATGGVAIKLEPHAEISTVPPPQVGGFLLSPQWVKVLYQPEEQDRRIERVLRGIARSQIAAFLKPGQLGNAKDLIVAVLSSLAASLKDEAYSEEREVRLIAYPLQGQQPDHRGTDRGVVPYIELMHYENHGWAVAGLASLATPDAPLPIEEVRVGPPQGESERQRKIGVNSLLAAHGFDVPVNGSDIAYLA